MSTPGRRGALDGHIEQLPGYLGSLPVSDDRVKLPAVEVVTNSRKSTTRDA